MEREWNEYALCMLILNNALELIVSDYFNYKAQVDTHSRAVTGKCILCLSVRVNLFGFKYSVCTGEYRPFSSRVS